MLVVSLGHSQHQLAPCFGCLQADVLHALSLLAILAGQSQVLNYLALLLRVDPSTLFNHASASPYLLATSPAR